MRSAQNGIRISSSQIEQHSCLFVWRRGHAGASQLTIPFQPKTHTHITQNTHTQAGPLSSKPWPPLTRPRVGREERRRHEAQPETPPHTHKVPGAIPGARIAALQGSDAAAVLEDFGRRHGDCELALGLDRAERRELKRARLAGRRPHRRRLSRFANDF